MIKAIFFDWFNTLAHYYPPREELESQALKELGFAVSPKELSYGLYLGDKMMYEENARIPVRLRSREDQTQLYMRFHRTILKEVNINSSDEVVLKLLKRMLQLNDSMKFVLFDDVITTLKTLKKQDLKLGLLTNLQTEVGSMCRELGIAEYLDFTVTSGEAGADKPQPPIFLKAGDVVTKVDSTDIATAAALGQAIRSHSSGDTVTVTYVRGGTTTTAKVTLGSAASTQVQPN